MTFTVSWPEKNLITIYIRKGAKLSQVSECYVTFNRCCQIQRKGLSIMHAGDALTYLSNVRPSFRQLRWQEMEMYAFIHFGRVPHERPVVIGEGGSRSEVLVGGFHFA